MSNEIVIGFSVAILYVTTLMLFFRNAWLERRIDDLEADSHPPIDLTPAMIDVMKSVRAICDQPPAGWYCTRGYGHMGPCAAHRAD